MKLDDAIVEELDRAGPGTEKEIGERLAGRLYAALQRLVHDRIINHDAFSSPRKENIYGLPGQNLFPKPIGRPTITRRI
jgi:hypothetical protein